jgi:hypothetical protein
MVTKWYAVKVKRIVIDDNGNQGTETENYLIEGLNYTDAEVSISKKMEELSNKFRIESIVKQQIENVLLTELSNEFYENKVSVYDDDSEKTISFKIIVEADSIINSVIEIDETYSDGGADYRVVSCVLKPYLEVFPMEEDHQVDIFDVIKEESKKITT